MLEIQKRLLAGETPDQICTPLGIHFKETNGECIFSYDQIESFKFKNDPVVKECRGLILNTSDWSIAAYPFRRFMNYGEDGADELPSDLSDCFLLEKLDGSLVTLRWSKTCNAWKVSTRKMIYAEGNVNDLSSKTFEQLFWEGAAKTKIPKFIEMEILDKGFTYSFELCSPLNRVVTPYAETTITLLLVRNNITLKEASIESLDMFSMLLECGLPKKFSLTAWEEILQSFSNKDAMFEGYVVVKESLPSHLRVKVKNPAYLAISKLNISKSKKAFVELLKLGEKDEYLNYYPENKEFIEKIENSLKIVENTIKTDWGRLQGLLDRKSFALEAVLCKFPHVLFELFTKKTTLEELSKYLMGMRTEQILNALEKVDTK